MRAIARLPRGAGIIFRHYGLPPTERRGLFDRVRRRARHKAVVLLLAGSARQAARWGADGWHGRRGGRRVWPMLQSAPVHSMRELRAAQRDGADLLFLSPLFPTRSHPGAIPLGRVRFGMIARRAHVPVIALGGMTSRRAGLARRLGAYGWAAIDGLTA